MGRLSIKKQEVMEEEEKQRGYRIGIVKGSIGIAAEASLKLLEFKKLSININDLSQDINKASESIHILENSLKSIKPIIFYGEPNSIFIGKPRHNFKK